MALNGLPAGRIAWRLEGPDALTGPLAAPYGIVVANILLNTLVELSPQIARKVAPGGRLVLAGLLAHQQEQAAAAYVAQGLTPRGSALRDGWIRVELARNELKPALH